MSNHRHINLDESTVTETLECGCKVMMDRGELDGYNSMRWQDVKVSEIEYCKQHGSKSDDDDIIVYLEELIDGKHEFACNNNQDGLCHCYQDTAQKLYDRLKDFFKD